MIAEQVEAKFPPGVSMPHPIRCLCGFLDHYGYPISGCFEISTIGDDDLAFWFPNDLAMQHQFAVFGRGSTGSVYALWLRGKRDTESAPVIVLGSEGELLVLAKNSLEFCRLLGCGYDELEWDDITEQASDWHTAQPLRDWLATELSIDCPITGESIVSTAKESFTDFSEFVQQWQRENSQ